MSGFKKAIRKSVKLKLAITGPTGSGKTFSALRLAKGLGGKIAVIDTENGSASLYSEFFEFDVLDITPPFTTEKYIEAINMAEKAGYDIVVIDSLTHAWAGEGGLLEQKAMLDSRPNSNQWANWKPIDKKDNEFKNAFLHSKCHIIATMRSKMEYAQTEDNGKKKVQKVGLAPVQRDGLSYDFTIVFDIAMDHITEVSKDRTNLFKDRIFKITEETGEEIKKWIDGGAKETKELIKEEIDKVIKEDLEFKEINESDLDNVLDSIKKEPTKIKNEAPISLQHQKELFNISSQKGIKPSDLQQEMLIRFKVEKTSSLKIWQFEELMNDINNMK